MTIYTKTKKYITGAVLSTVMVFSLVTHTAQAETFSRGALQQMLNTALAQVAVLQNQLLGLSTGDTTRATSVEINIGDSVRVIESDLSVRSEAAGDRIGIAQQGAIAEVVGGPRQIDGYTWWLLDYQTGPDGWSAGSWLSPIAGGTVTDGGNDIGNQESQSDDTPDTADTASYEIKLGSERVSGNSTLVDFVRLCQRHITFNPLVDIDCVWDDRVIRSQDGLAGYVPGNGGVSLAAGNLSGLIAEYQADSNQDADTNSTTGVSDTSISTSGGSQETSTLEVIFSGSQTQSEVRKTKSNLTKSEAFNWCLAYKNANRGIPQDCKWDGDVIDSNGSAGTPIPSGGIIEPGSDDVSDEEVNFTPPTNPSCDVGYSGPEVLDPSGPYNHLCGTGEMKQVRYYQRAFTRILSDNSCSTRMLLVRSEYNCNGVWNSDSDGR